MSKRVRFMNNNYIERSFTYSSQLSSFPASNIYNNSRSKIWKPAGNFEITSTNNKIYINDGSNKTITLTSGSYLYSTLATHIQTQLNSLSSGWTVIYTLSTGKFTISRSSSATLRITQTSNAAWDTIGFIGTSDLTALTFVADAQRNHTSEWIQCDLGVPQMATFVALLSGIDSIFTLSENATVKLRANNIDYWVSPPVDITIPVGDISCMTFFDDTVTASYRYWRLEIIDRANYNGAEGIELAYAYIGDHTTITNTNFTSGFNLSYTDPSNVLQSENGALFVDIKPRYLTVSSAGIQLLADDEYRDIQQLFYDLGVRNPFFISIDPDILVSGSLEEMTRFVIMSRTPTFDHIFRNYYNVSFEFREAF